MSNGATAAPSIRQPEAVDDGEPSNEFALLRPEEETARGELSVRRFNIGNAKKDPFRPIRERVQTQLLRESNRYLKLDDRPAVQAQIVTMLDEALADEGIQPARVDYMRILDSISNEVLGFGPIQSLLDDDTCTEIMV